MMDGSCLCGEVTFTIKGDFDRFYICHCQYCRKDSGTAHRANLFTKASALTWLTGRDTVTDFRLEGTRHSKSFCSICGSAVPSVNQDKDFCLVPAGSLDEDLSFKPQAHIFMESRANWEDELATLPEFAKYPQ